MVVNSPMHILSHGTASGGLFHHESFPNTPASKDRPVPKMRRTLENIRAADLIRRGELRKVTREDVIDMFDVFNLTTDGEVSLKELEPLIMQIIPDHEMQTLLKQLLAAGGKDNKSIITLDEFHQALRLGSANELEDLLRFMHGEKETEGCSGEVLQQYLTDKIKTNENCISLPFYLLFFGLIWVLTVVHLEIFVSHRQNLALKAVLLDAPKLDSLRWTSPDELWDWADKHVIPALFGSTPKGRLMSNNQVVGGLLLERNNAETLPCYPRVLQGLYGEEEGASCYGEFEETKRAHWFPLENSLQKHHQELQKLRTSQWLTYATRSIDVSLMVYNGANGFLTVLRLTFAVERGGHWLLTQHLESFSANPYDNDASYYGLLVLLDLMFCMMAGLILGLEVKALIELKRSSVDLKRAFLENYLEFWKVIDWTNIIQSLLIVLHWAVDVSATLSVTDDLLKLPRAGEPGYGTPPAELYERAYQASVGYRHLRWYVTIFTVTSMLRFFKAFRANARLNIVTRTIVVAAKDLVHFAVVFLCIFFAFVLMGHLLYGPRVHHFSRFATACDTCVMMLVGLMLDEIRADMLQSTGGTGVAWIYAYIVIMQLILVNMILVVIFDTYAEVKGHVHNAPTLFEQAVKLWKQKKQQSQRMEQARASLTQRSRTTITDSSSPNSSSSSPKSLSKSKTMEELHKMANVVRDSQILSMLRNPSNEFPVDGWTPAMLSSKLEGLSISQARDLITNAKEFAKAEKGEGQGLSLFDTVRLIKRVDANVQEIMRCTHEANGNVDSARKSYKGVTLGNSYQASIVPASNLRKEFEEAEFEEDEPEPTKVPWNVLSGALPPVPPSRSYINGSSPGVDPLPPACPPPSSPPLPTSPPLPYHGLRAARIVE